MKTWHFLFLALPVLASAQEKRSPNLPDIGIKPEALRAMLPGLAAKIEDKFKSQHPEADGLVERVEAILATTPPAPPRDGDKNHAIAQRMRLLTLDISASATLGSIEGYIFDNSPTGHIQRYRDLESVTATDANEVRRWLAMRHAAHALEWKDKEQMCQQRAIAAARALITRESKNPDAHALLAIALDWEDDSDPETLAALQAALKLDAKHPLALQFLAARHLDKALETAAFRRPSRPAEKLPEDINQQLYTHPLSSEEYESLQKDLTLVASELDHALDCARERSDAAACLRVINSGLQLRFKAVTASASRNRDPSQSFEQFLGSIAIANTQVIFSIFENPARYALAVKLAGENAEALGTIHVVAVAGQTMRSMKSGRPFSDADAVFSKGLTQKLADIALADDSINAARASEALGIAGMFSIMTGRPPAHPEIFFRALQLDPFRHRTLNLLLGACMAVDPSVVSAAAVMEMQLAVLPNLWTRRQCAAAAAKLHDWGAAFRHLDACAREKPGDLMVLSQRVVTTLRQSESKAAIKKAALYYDGITADNLLEKTAALDKGDRREFIENFLLLLALQRQIETAGTLLNQAVEARILDKEAAGELREVIR